MISSEKISESVELLRATKRPLFVWGAGMRPYRDHALAQARSLGIPIATTWGAVDLVPHNDVLNCGAFGTHGVRTANLAIQSSDLIISIGSRLDTKATGTPSDFAPKAKIVMVDIDQAEISKFDQLGRKIDIGICADVGDFLEAFAESLNQIKTEWPLSYFYVLWLEQIRQWKAEHVPQGPAYDLMRKISEHTTPDDIIVSDTGNTLGWIMQGFPFKGERFVHALNFTPMGYGLGGAVGAAFAGGGRRVVCIAGDGGALMSINELATIKRHDLNVKIILLNNKGHSMCRHTQRQWLGGKYPATSIEGGLGFPEFTDTARSFGIKSYHAKHIDEWSKHAIPTLLHALFDGDGPCFLEVDIDPDESLAFQVKYGEALA